MNERIDKLKKFLSESPNDQFVIHALALEYMKIEDFNKAEECFKLNIAIDPKYVATYYHLGKMYENQGKESAAIETYSSGMAIAKEIGDNHSFGELRSVYEELTF